MKKVKVIILSLVLVILILAVGHLVRNYIVLGKIYDDVTKMVNDDDNYKITSTIYMYNEDNTKVERHSVLEGYVKDGIYKEIWEFSPDYTEENKASNIKTIYRKDLKNNEESQITINADGQILAGNNEKRDESKYKFYWDKTLSKKDFINKYYFINMFSFINDEDGFYRIKQTKENYFKVKCYDNVCEIKVGNITSESPESFTNKLELDVVTDEDVKRIEIKP